MGWTRRRRKQRALWLPTQGNVVGEGEPAIGVTGQIPLSQGLIRWDAFPVTFDYSESVQNEPGRARNLHDLVTGNAWRLKRIVGKAFVWQAWTFPNSEEAPPLIDVAVGFMVCRTNDEGEIPTTDFNEVNPLAQESAEDPWVWRRRWLIGLPTGLIGISSNGVQVNQVAGFPASSAGYGSVADGPHIDSKMQRLIQREQRLFCVVAARHVNALDPNDVPGTPNGFLNYLIDYRLVGTLVNQAGNRRNASR